VFLLINCSDAKNVASMACIWKNKGIIETSH